MLYISDKDEEKRKTKEKQNKKLKKKRIREGGGLKCRQSSYPVNEDRKKNIYPNNTRNREKHEKMREPVLSFLTLYFLPAPSSSSSTSRDAMMTEYLSAWLVSGLGRGK